MFLEFAISALLNIQHQVSSISPRRRLYEPEASVCPENATISSISAMPVETFLCNVRVNSDPFDSATHNTAAKVRWVEPGPCARVRSGGPRKERLCAAITSFHSKRHGERLFSLIGSSGLAGKCKL